MRVFISWSGERSRLAAEALRIWLPRVIQTVRPWMSDSDISAGSRWLTDVSTALEETSVGIICVTQENMSSPWLHFEAGALSKALDQSRVCPMGLNLKPGQISGPLSQFQAVTIDAPGVLRVLATLNKLMDERSLPEGELSEIFSVWWPQLESQLAKIPEASSPKPARTTEDQLEELLQIAREQLRRENVRLEASKLKDEMVDNMVKLMEKSTASLEPLKQSILARVSSDWAQTQTQAGAHWLSDDLAAGNRSAKNLLATASKLSPETALSDLDTRAVSQMAEVAKLVQEESKLLTDRLLIDPKDGSESAGA